eukprot:sb/3469863/
MHKLLHSCLSGQYSDHSSRTLFFREMRIKSGQCSDSFVPSTLSQTMSVTPRIVSLTPSFYFKISERGCQSIGPGLGDIGTWCDRTRWLCRQALALFSFLSNKELARTVPSSVCGEVYMTAPCHTPFDSALRWGRGTRHCLTDPTSPGHCHANALTSILETRMGPGSGQCSDSDTLYIPLRNVLRILPTSNLSPTSQIVSQRSKDWAGPNRPSFGHCLAP